MMSSSVLRCRSSSWSRASAPWSVRAAPAISRAWSTKSSASGSTVPRRWPVVITSVRSASAACRPSGAAEGGVELVGVRRGGPWWGDRVVAGAAAEVAVEAAPLGRERVARGLLVQRRRHRLPRGEQWSHGVSKSAGMPHRVARLSGPRVDASRTARRRRPRWASTRTALGRRHPQVSQHRRVQIPPRHREHLLVAALGRGQQLRKRRPDHDRRPDAPPPCRTSGGRATGSCRVRSPMVTGASWG
jgi:hypothetical protein